MCAEDVDCQQGHFFCDAENKCQYQQPRDVPCSNETGCGNNEKYTCSEHNTCVLRTDIRVNMVRIIQEPPVQWRIEDFSERA